MADDSVLADLVQQARSASARPRRLAALVLLDVLQPEVRKADSADVIEPSLALAVAEEVRALTEEFGLAAGADGGSRQR